MAKFQIGIVADSLKTPIHEAVETAAQLGAQGIQVFATQGEIAADALSPQQRTAFLRFVKDHGLVISALCGDLGHGFGNSEHNPGLIERSKRIMDLAKDLETDIVTTHIGVVPALHSHPRYAVMQDACGQLAEYADSVGAHFAIETGPETAETLKRFLDSIGSKGVSVNLDPANFVMVTGDDPAQAVYTLREYIVHTHVKDGVKLLDRDPEVIYGIIRPDAIVTDDAFRETPLGEGDVPFDRYFAALSDIGYHGFLTIEREVGDDPRGDIVKAIEFLQMRI